MDLFKSKPTTVSDALVGVEKALADLEHVEQHNLTQHEEHTKIATEAAGKALAHKAESERAATLRKRFRDFITV